MRRLINNIKIQASLVNDFANPKLGIISSYDPDSYMCKVTLQLEDKVAGIPPMISGWIPVGSIWVGNGWGVFCPPSIGDLVEVDFEEGDFEAGNVYWRFYTDLNQPVRSESGVFYIIHKTGSSIKFENDGSIIINSPQIELDGYVKTTGHVEVKTGASGTFVDKTGKTVTVKNGIVVGIK